MPGGGGGVTSFKRAVIAKRTTAHHEHPIPEGERLKTRACHELHGGREEEGKGLATKGKKSQQSLVVNP